MEHHTFSTLSGRILFHTWEEGVVLYERLCSAVPAATAIIVMPNHIHILTPPGQRSRLTRAIRSHARTQNHLRGTSGRLFQFSKPPTICADYQKVANSERYIWLNPCRASLTDDPLKWPLSNYRDALGFGIHPQRQPARHPMQLHRAVSSDRFCSPSALHFPSAIPSPTLADVAHTAAWLYRTTLEHTTWRGPARTAAVRAARTFTDANVNEVATRFQVTARTCRRMTATQPSNCFAKLLGDPLMRALPTHELTTLRWADWLR